MALVRTFWEPVSGKICETCFEQQLEIDHDYRDELQEKSVSKRTGGNRTPATLKPPRIWQGIAEGSLAIS